MEKVENHKEFIELSYREAIKAYNKGEVPVGAVIVRDGKVIGKGYNCRLEKNNALYHAEIVAIENACKNTGSWRLDGSTIYVTLEPCLMCVGAILQARINKVVFTTIDEKGGCLVSKLHFDRLNLPFSLSYEYIPDFRTKLLLKTFFYELRKKTTLQQISEEQ